MGAPIGPWSRRLSTMALGSAAAELGALTERLLEATFAKNLMGEVLGPRHRQFCSCRFGDEAGHPIIRALFAREFFTTPDHKLTRATSKRNPAYVFATP